MRAVVFDFDGVLVDSEPLHYRALRDCLAAEGIGVDEDEYRRVYLAYTDREAVRIALERAGLGYDADRVERLCAAKARAFESVRGQVPVFPGARELVRLLAGRAPLAIASGALRSEIDALLDGAGIAGAFRVVVSADDVRHGKPDPEPYRLAVERLNQALPGLAPADCVAVEDSVAGIASARAAGLRVVGVTHSYPAERLRLADLVVSSLEELTPELLAAAAGPGGAFPAVLHAPAG